eukprot:52823-Rhodomonas_salina.1
MSLPVSRSQPPSHGHLEREPDLDSIRDWCWSLSLDPTQAEGKPEALRPTTSTPGPRARAAGGTGTQLTGRRPALATEPNLT